MADGSNLETSRESKTEAPKGYLSQSFETANRLLEDARHSSEVKAVINHPWAAGALAIGAVTSLALQVKFHISAGEKAVGRLAPRVGFSPLTTK